MAIRNGSGWWWSRKKRRVDQERPRAGIYMQNTLTSNAFTLSRDGRTPSIAAQVLWQMSGKLRYAVIILVHDEQEALS